MLSCRTKPTTSPVPVVVPPEPGDPDDPEPLEPDEPPLPSSPISLSQSNPVPGSVWQLRPPPPLYLQPGTSMCPMTCEQSSVTPCRAAMSATSAAVARYAASEYHFDGSSM